MRLSYALGFTEMERKRWDSGWLNLTSISMVCIYRSDGVVDVAMLYHLSHVARLVTYPSLHTRGGVVK
jgi:hypothetical protein